MPKLKTNRAAAKRFKVTASGKVKASPAFSNHILTKKTSKRKRKLRKSAVLDSVETRKIKAMLPYA